MSTPEGTGFDTSACSGLVNGGSCIQTCLTGFTAQADFWDYPSQYTCPGGMLWTNKQLTCTEDRRQRRGLISKTASGDTAPHRDRRADGELAANWTRYEVLGAVEGIDTFTYRDTLGIDHAFRIKEGLVVVFPSGSLHWVNSTNPQRSMRSFTTSDATGEPVGDPSFSFLPGTSDSMVGRCSLCAAGKFRPIGVPSFVKCAPYTVCNTDFEYEVS